MSKQTLRLVIEVWEEGTPFSPRLQWRNRALGMEDILGGPTEEEALLSLTLLPDDLDGLKCQAVLPDNTDPQPSLTHHS